MGTIELALKNHDELVIINSALLREKSLLEWEIRRLTATLTILEKKYGMNSETFITRYEEGKMGDEKEIMMWAGEYKFYERFRAKLKSLEDLIVECQRHTQQ